MNSAPPAQTGSPARVRAALALLTLVAVGLLALRVPLASEVRYVESAREMVESGDWIVPHLAHVPYFEKPILLYWTAAASRLLFGSSGIAVRLPSILAAVASVLLTFEMARALLGTRLGLRASLLLLGAGFFAVLGSVLVTDTLFAACLWAAWFAYWRSLGGARGWKWAYALALALGFMTKGPLALILVLGSIGLFHVLDQPWSAGEGGLLGRWSARIGGAARVALREAALVRVTLALLALNLPWSIAVWQRDPRFLEFFYVRENFKAFFDGQVHHQQYAFFYALVIPAAFAPWSLAVAAGLLLALARRVGAGWRGSVRAAPRDESERLRTFLGAIVLFTLLFLQASSAKLASYPLPILPAIAILAVDAWCARGGEPARWVRWTLALGALLTLAGVGIFLAQRRAELRQVLDTTPAGVRDLVLATLGCAVLLMLASGVLALARRAWSSVALAGVALYALALVAGANLHALGLALNVQPLAEIIAARAAPEDRIVTSSQFVQDYTLQLVTRRRAALVGKARELGMGFFAEVTPSSTPVPPEPYGVRAENLPQNDWLWTPERLAQELRSATRRVWFVGSRQEVDALVAENPALHVLGTVDDARLCSNRE